MSEGVVLAEQSVLGAMLLSPRAVEEVSRLLIGRDFSLPKHELIFDAVVMVRANGDPVDVVTVADRLINDGDLERAGGVEYLHSLTSIVPTAANAAYYAGLVAEDSTRRGLTLIGQRLQQRAAEPGVALAEAIDDLRALRDRMHDGSRVRMLRDVLDVPETEKVYDWVIEGLLERRDRLVLTGTEGGGKSTLLRQLVIMSSAGLHPFRFGPMAPVRALVVDVENSELQWRREVERLAGEAALRGGKDPRDQIALQCVTKLDISRARDLGRIHRWIDEATPDVVLIGPLYKLVPRAIKDDDTAAPVIDALDSIRDRNVALLVEAHAGHGVGESGSRDLRPRGSSALLGWPEFGFGLRKDKGLNQGRELTSLVRWRGDRERGRGWPAKLTPGRVWPWEPTVGL